MKKLGLIVKQTQKRFIEDNLKDTSCVFILNYAKVSGPDFSTLRQSLRSHGARFVTVKNSVCRRALKETGQEKLLNLIEGPCGLVFVKDDPVGTSKILYNFSREHEFLKLRGGFLKDRILAATDIEALARLPSQEVLRAQLVMTLNLPLSGLVLVLKQLLRRFIYCLDQIRNKKGS
ncbi:MAG: 50S ribosomal protein L10 [Candidatus Omnitrophica bacterium]|nr:50S ribosomal protein L10 [Candidatus Omnitrophota bacterium]